MVYLIILDFLWSAAAMTVDFPKLMSIDPWFWILVVICPIYPFLLGLVWLTINKKIKPNPYLLAFAVLPSAVFGVLALVYYPLKMVFQGFALRDVGQIFWVLFYSIQGWYLLTHFKTKSASIFIAFTFLCVALIIDYKFKTLGYLTFVGFPQISILALFIIGLVSSFLVAVSALKRTEFAK